MGAGKALLILGAIALSVGAMFVVLRWDGGVEEEQFSHYWVTYDGAMVDGHSRPGYLHVDRADAAAEVPFLVAAFDAAKATGSAVLSSSAQDQAATDYLSDLAPNGVNWRLVEFEESYFKLAIQLG